MESIKALQYLAQVATDFARSLPASVSPLVLHHSQEAVKLIEQALRDKAAETPNA